MITVNENIIAMITADAREIRARAGLYNGSTLSQMFSYTDALKSVKVDRLGVNGKFFGFGVTHKLTIELIDNERAINIVKGQRLHLEFGTATDYINSYPVCVIDDVKRDENTNGLTIIAYCILQDAKALTYADLTLAEDYTLQDIAFACATILSVPILFEGITDDALNLLITSGGNFEGTETIKEILDDIAEALQAIYFINKDNVLIFKRLDKAGDAVLNIDKSQYFTLKAQAIQTIQSVTITNELEDGITATTGTDGAQQFIRDNGFYELQEEKGILAEKALEAVAGLSITPFDCDFRGNFLLEIGDKVTITAKDGSLITSYILNDSISYSGGLSEQISWSTEESTETAGNPSTLGDALKKTFAKVDKANKEIELVAGETAALKLTAESLQASVVALDNNMAGVMQEVNTKMSAEDVQIAIKQSKDEGTERVTTSTGFTFDEKGLTIEKSNSEIKTTITEDGMQISKDNTEVLSANNQGVYAEDLHATTFLIIGNNSRIESYGGRTGCFWIGG